MSTILKFVGVLLLGYFIASIGAWIAYPEYIFKPELLILCWYTLFPWDIPNSVIISTSLGVSLMVISFKSQIKQKGKYGFAKLARVADIKKSGLNFKRGIIFGKFKGKFIKSDKPLSVLILAPPGTGKTAGIVIPTLLTLDDSMIIHDPKGELYETTSRQRKKFGEVCLFDPLSDNSSKFNVFAKAMLPTDKRDIRGYIINNAGLLFKEIKEGDKYFIDAAKSAFLFFTEWLIWQNGETSLPEIRKKLLEDADIGTTVREMVATKDLPEHIKQDGHGVLISEDSEKQWAGVVGTLKEGLEIFADPRVAVATSGGCDFNGYSFREKTTSLYLIVRDKDSKRLESIVSMLIESLASQLISVMPKAQDNKVVFVLDEFVRIGKIESIKNLPAVSRGYNVNSIFVAQDYAQIASIYGQDSVSIFETNCAYKIIFTQNNYQTAKRISDLIGNQTIKRVSYSKSSSNKALTVQSQEGRSKSQSEEGIALITPQDIVNLEPDKCIILAQGNISQPIKAKIAFYYKDSFLKKLAN
jgi:type IV secretion system protein VirD4